MKKGIFIALLAMLAQTATAAVQNISASGGEVEFLAIGKPAFIKIHGTGAAPTGQLAVADDKISGQFEFEVGSLATGIEMRDEHMKTKYLEVSKYPKATLALTSVSPIKGWSKTSPKVDDADFNGVLTLHGVSKPVMGKFTVNGDSKVDVTFHVKLSDFSVAIPTFAGITVADDVEVKVIIDKLQ